MEAVIVHPDLRSATLTLYGQVQTSALMRAVASDNSRVVEVLVNEGEVVQQGQPLIILDPRDFEPRVVKARAEVEEFEAQLQLEKKRYASGLEALKHEQQLLRLLKAQVTRMEKLRRRNLGSDAAVDQARMELERQALAVTARSLEVDQHPARLAQIEAKLERARANLAQAELALERSRVQAPFTGVVAAVDVAVGDYVKANQPLVSLYPRTQLEVRAKVPAPYQQKVLVSLENGRQLQALGETLGARFPLQLSRLAGQAEAGGIDALFSLVGEEGAQLRVGVPVTVQLSLPSKSRAVAVPYSALYGSNRLYRILDNRLQAVQVNILGNVFHGNEEWVLVHSPRLANGDLILVTHLPEAAEGLSVQPRVIGEGS